MDEIFLGQSVIYYDEDRQPNAAIITHIFKDKIDPRTDRPTCNLAIFLPEGFARRRVGVAPAFHRPELNKWAITNKWALNDEVPDDEWNYAAKEQHLPGPAPGAGL